MLPILPAVALTSLERGVLASPDFCSVLLFSILAPSDHLCVLCYYRKKKISMFYIGMKRLIGKITKIM